MKVFVEDLKNNRKFEMPECDIKLIKIGHILSVKYLDNNNNVKEIDGIVTSIKYEFGLERIQTVRIGIL